MDQLHKKIIVLNNCVDDNQFFPIKRKETTHITVLFSGSLSERKGLSQLLLFSDFLEQNDVGIELKIASNTTSNSYMFTGRKRTTVLSDISFDKMWNNVTNKLQVVDVPEAITKELFEV